MIRTNLKDGKYKISVLPRIKKEEFSFSDEKDKFLFGRSKTVGFRKDKKINKFVGIRNGHSKQLEFTIQSIILDDKNLIPKNRINFNSISLENELVVHKINDTVIYNKVSGNNFKNLIKVDNPFEYFEVIYEVHTKGIKVNNTKIRNLYYCNKDNQFIFVDDINEETLFIIDTPVAIDVNNNEHEIISHELYIEDDKLFYKKISRYITDKYDFPLLIDTNILINDINLYIDGVGVIESKSDNWDDVYKGNGELNMNSSISTYESAVGIYYKNNAFLPPPDEYVINRTFLNYDTSIFSSYTDVLSSVKLKLYNDKTQNTDAGITVFVGTQSNNLSENDWKNFSSFITEGSINNGDVTEFDIPFDYINLNDFSKFVLRESNYDAVEEQPNLNINSFTGLDFSRTTLEIIFEPVKVYGQTQTNVVRGDYFYVTAFTNSGTSETIEWYREWDGESGYTGFLGSGSEYMGYSMEFIENNKIYAVKPFINSPVVYSVPLEVTINVMELNYPKIPDRFEHYGAIDMDSIYFKFYKCLSGVCYTYTRDLDNIYEGNLLVSDTENDESYNLYNEFDIIDEFFINSVKVDVAYNQNLDLKQRFNFIDGVIIRQGTRILLLNQTNENEIGIYTAKYDNHLIKTNELDNPSKTFRLKIHVRYGTYGDKEIHVIPPIVNV